MDGQVRGARVRFGWNVPGTMTRLGLHVGMILAWIRYFPGYIPDLVVATSAGAIIMACCISFEPKRLARVRHVVANLRREQIFVMSPGLMRTGALLLAAGATLVITAAAAGSLGGLWSVVVLAGAALYAYTRVRGTQPTIWLARIAVVSIAAFAAWRTPLGWASAILYCAGLFLFDWLLVRSLQTFFKEVQSPFDNSPLRRLMLDEDVPRSTFLAPTELRVLSADVRQPGPMFYSNHDPRMCDPENPEHVTRFLEGGILGSSALPGRFNLRVVDGTTPRDGEVWSDFPIEQFAGSADVVFRFDYWDPLPPGPEPKHWLADLFRSFDVMRDHNTLERMQRYELERAQDPSLPRVVPIRASRRLLARIPELAVYNFKPGQLRSMISLGMRIVRENRALIRRELGIEARTAVRTLQAVS